MLHDALAHALFGQDEPEEVNVLQQYQLPSDGTHEGGAAAAVDSPRRPLAASAPPLSYSPRTGQQQLPPSPPYDQYTDHPSADAPHGDHTQPTPQEQVSALWSVAGLMLVLCASR
jgi:hypothetical protein